MDGVGPWPQVQESARLHSTVVFADGMKYMRLPDGSLKHMPHRGGIVIGKNVYVGPHTVIHRARDPEYPTTIEEGVQIGALNNVGHHSVIGENTLITQGVMISGSVRIGKRCYIAPNVSIKQHVKICDDVFIGLGAIVVNNIEKPGVWYGQPARWVRDWDGSF